MICIAYQCWGVCGGRGRDGKGREGMIWWCMWITYRSKCYFLICANVIHRPWAVNLKLVNVTKKKVCSLYSSASLLHIHRFKVTSVSDFFTHSVRLNRWTSYIWRWVFVSQSVVKSTVIKVSISVSGHQTCPCQRWHVFKGIVWYFGRCLLSGGLRRSSTSLILSVY